MEGQDEQPLREVRALGRGARGRGRGPGRPRGEWGSPREAPWGPSGLCAEKPLTGLPGMLLVS